MSDFSIWRISKAIKNDSRKSKSQDFWGRSLIRLKRRTLHLFSKCAVYRVCSKSHTVLPYHHTIIPICLRTDKVCDIPSMLVDEKCDSMFCLKSFCKSSFVWKECGKENTKKFRLAWVFCAVWRKENVSQSWYSMTKEFSSLTLDTLMHCTLTVLWSLCVPL